MPVAFDAGIWGFSAEVRFGKVVYDVFCKIVRKVEYVVRYSELCADSLRVVYVIYAAAGLFARYSDVLVVVKL